MSVQLANAWQVRRIHILKHKLRIEESLYRSDILGSFRVTTSKHLTQGQAAELINRLESEAVALGVWQEPGTRKRFGELGGRPDMASPRQLRMLEALWMSVSRQPTREDAGRALNRFIKRIAGVDHIAFLGPVEARKVIKAIRSMKWGERHGTVADAG